MMEGMEPRLAGERDRARWADADSGPGERLRLVRRMVVSSNCCYDWTSLTVKNSTDTLLFVQDRPFMVTDPEVKKIRKERSSGWFYSCMRRF